MEKTTEINLNLDLTEINTIIRALSERPFREVYELIGKIHSQSNAQINPTPLRTLG